MKISAHFILPPPSSLLSSPPLPPTLSLINSMDHQTKSRFQPQAHAMPLNKINQLLPLLSSRDIRRPKQGHSIHRTPGLRALKTSPATWRPKHSLPTPGASMPVCCAALHQPSSSPQQQVRARVESAFTANILKHAAAPTSHVIRRHPSPSPPLSGSNSQFVPTSSFSANPSRLNMVESCALIR